MTQYLNPAALVPPVGPYSHVSRTGDLIYLAGQTGIDAKGDPAGPGIAAQTGQALENIRAALASQNLTFAHIIKLTTYVAGRTNLPGMIEYMDETFPTWFPRGYPPNTLLVVDQLVTAELLVEIEAVAHA